MRFLANENFPGDAVAALLSSGHDVVWMRTAGPGTSDKDFGELVFRRQQINAGVLLIRLAGLSHQAKAELVAAMVRDHSTEMPGAFSVLSPGMIRIRNQP